MPFPADLTRPVGNLLREVAARSVLPRFRRLEDGEIREKQPGELVTIADQEAEASLASGLLRLLPSSRVVGEEACAADPSLLLGLGSGLVWLVDPLDGTANFAAGDPRFSLMVALLHDGDAIASWMLDPLADRLATAQRGGGAYLDGARISRIPEAPGGSLHGVVKTRFLPASISAALDAQRPGMPVLHPGTGSAGLDYPALADGRWQFLFYWRTLAWDHAPGALFITEAGGLVARLDGSAYRPEDRSEGMLVARDADVWRRVRGLLPPDKPGG